MRNINNSFLCQMTCVGKIIPPTDGNRVLPPGKFEFRSWEVVFMCVQVKNTARCFFF